MLVEVVVLVFNKSLEVDCFSFSLTSSSDVCLRFDPSFDPMFSSDVSFSFVWTGEKKERSMVYWILCFFFVGISNNTRHHTNFFTFNPFKILS